MVKQMFLKLIIISTCFLLSCISEKATPDYNSFPTDIGKVIITQCAVTGCHDSQSKDAAAGLSLESWSKMFEGSRSGAVVIPFRHDYSTLFFACNTYADLGIQTLPTMPLGKTPLSKSEMVLLRNWIDEGAPDKNGFVKFSDNPNRRKLYVTNQGCDVVSIFDIETGLQMRTVDVGNVPLGEYPHMVKASHDGAYWYVLMGAGLFQKFKASDNTLVGEINIATGMNHYWSTFAITSDSKKAFCIGGLGSIAYINIETMSLEDTWAGFESYPFGSAVNSTNDTLYVTAKASSNFIYKIPFSDPTSAQMISLQQGVAPSTNPAQLLEPYDIIFSPDGSKYFVTCPKTNEVRVIKKSNDSLLAVIPTGVLPQKLSISKNTDYLFVSCSEDTLSFPGLRGSVIVIDYQTHSFVKKIYTGCQPHGIEVDNIKNKVYVANRNVSSQGPAPHHASKCEGRNGYITAIDINTLELVPGYKAEVSVDPFGLGIAP